LGLYADSEGNVVAFPTRDQAKTFAEQHAITIDAESNPGPLHDLDRVTRRLADPSGETNEASHFPLCMIFSGRLRTPSSDHATGKKTSRSASVKSSTRSVRAR